MLFNLPFVVTDIEVNGLDVISINDFYVVRNVPAEIDMLFSYAHLYGAPLSNDTNIHLMTISAASVDMRADGGSSALDILHEETTIIPLAQLEINNKTISLR